MCVRHFETEHGHAHFFAGYGLFYGFGHTFGEQGHCRQFVIVQVEYIVFFMLGHYQCVAPVDRVYVKKGEETVVFCYFVAGYLSIYYS